MPEQVTQGGSLILALRVVANPHQPDAYSKGEVRYICKSAADELSRMREALVEIADMGYAGAPDIRMRHIARAALAQPPSAKEPKT